MELYPFLKSLADQDESPIVICDLAHTIVYMNPAACRRYAPYGGEKLLGGNLLRCHSKKAAEKIRQVLEWFACSRDHNRVYTFYNPEENKDVYMVALRNDAGELIGYYEKHAYRNRETAALYAMEG